MDSLNMEIIKKALGLLACASLLAGCASTEPVRDNQHAGLREVGVVALIKDEFQFTKVGLTLLNTEEFTRDISDWELDKLATQTVLDALRNDKTTVNPVALPVNPSLAAKLYRQKGVFGSYVNINRIKGDLQALVDKNPVDAIILIHSEQVQDPIQNTSINLYGTGLYYRVTPFDEQPFIKPYSFLRIMVLDGKTLRPVNQKLVKCISSNYGRTSLLWDKGIKTNFPDAQWNGLKVEIRQMIKIKINGALKQISL